jgi:predicted house-cleaning NTP pyrophosphatase (Maf/HAM1 superfamily)
MITKIEGDFFSVLGLPLLDVLEYLRSRGLLSS